MEGTPQPPKITILLLPLLPFLPITVEAAYCRGKGSVPIGIGFTHSHSCPGAVAASAQLLPTSSVAPKSIATTSFEAPDLVAT